jgi:hypothetical protein
MMAVFLFCICKILPSIVFAIYGTSEQEPLLGEVDIPTMKCVT